MRARAGRGRHTLAQGTLLNRGHVRGSIVIAAASLVGALTTPGCSSPDLRNTNFSCTTNADCLDGKICGMVGGVPACLLPQNAPLRIGMSAPFQGPSQDLGIEMRRGISALFKHVNDEGGVLGRPLELDTRNDNYDPDTALANTLDLLNVVQPNDNPDAPDLRGPASVFALLGNVGTPTMLKTAPVATKNHVIFFAPFTGSQRYLRDGTNSPYVFNYRAGYYEETEAMIDYLATFRAPQIINGPSAYDHLLAFTQNDAYGDAGYAGLVNAYNTRIAPLPQPNPALPEPSIARINYQREDLASVTPAIAQAEDFLSGLLARSASVGGVTRVAIVMIDTYEPGNKFIRGVKDWINADASRAASLEALFLHVSFVGSDSLAQALTRAPGSYVDVTDPTGVRTKTYASNVLVTQVVPYYWSQSAGITAYRTDIAQFDAGTYNFTSLEGYIAARLLVKAMMLNGPQLDSDALVETLNTKVGRLDLGIGALLDFSSVNHQASHQVWGSSINDDGTFSIPFQWNPEERIIPGAN